MNTSKELPFWLRRVDLPVTGQAAATTVTELNVPAIAKVALFLALIVAALFGIVHQMQRAYAISNEIEAARSQCSNMFLTAAKQIGGQHGESLSLGSVTVERFTDRDSGPDYLDCSADVGMGHDQQPDRWMAEVRPGEAITPQSARLAGVEMVDELHRN